MVAFRFDFRGKMQNKRIMGNGENRTLVVRLIRLVAFICLLFDLFLPEYISSAT